MDLNTARSFATRQRHDTVMCINLTSMGLLLGQAEAVAEAAAVLLGSRVLRRSW